MGGGAAGGGGWGDRGGGWGWGVKDDLLTGRFLAFSTLESSGCPPYK